MALLSCPGGLFPPDGPAESITAVVRSGNEAQAVDLVRQADGPFVGRIGLARGAWFSVAYWFRGRVIHTDYAGRSNGGWVRLSVSAETVRIAELQDLGIVRRR